MPHTVVFTHIGKTAGTAVSSFLHAGLTQTGRDVLTFRGASSVFADRRCVARMLNGLDGMPFAAVTGHVPFSVARRFFPAARFCTVLRDPRWQLISGYCSQPPHKASPDYGMAHFIADIQRHPTAEWAIDNMQTRMLADDFRFARPVTPAMLASAKGNLRRHYALVGFQEQIDDFVARLAYLCGLSPPATVSGNETGPYHAHVTDAHLAFAAVTNAIDLDLYAWAREAFPLAAAPRCGQVVAPEVPRLPPRWRDRLSADLSRLLRYAAPA